MLLQAATNACKFVTLPVSYVRITGLSWNRARFARIDPARAVGAALRLNPLAAIRCSLNRAVLVVPSVTEAREHTPAVAGTPKAPLAGMMRPLQDANCAGPP